MTDLVPADTSIGGLIDEIARVAQENASADTAPVIAAGTFVLYAMADGGVMFVTDGAEGMLNGTQHTRIPPGLIRAMSALAGGGSKLDAVKALVRRPRPPRAIEAPPVKPIGLDHFVTEPAKAPHGTG